MVALAILASCSPDGTEPASTPPADQESSPSPSEVPLTQAPLPKIESIKDAGGVAIETTPDADWVLVAFGRAWVSDYQEGVYSFDARTGSSLRTARLADPCASMDEGFGYVWTLTCRPTGVARIDPVESKVTGQVTLPVSDDDGEYSLGAGEGAVWAIADGDDCLRCVVARIDPESVEVTERFDVPAGATAIRAGSGGLWLTYFDSDEVLHVDPSTGEVVAAIPVADGPRFLDVGEGGVWVMAQEDGAACHIDPADDRLVGCTVVDPAGIFGGDISIGEGYVWLRASNELVAQIDASSGEVVRRIGDPEGSGGVGVGSGHLWMAAHFEVAPEEWVATLYRVPL
jgi:streptogramin lyase